MHQKSDICHYWYFLNFSFKFQPNVCNRCHDFVNSSNIAILNIKGSDYRYIISSIIKNRAIKLMQNADLTEKNLKHKKIIFIYKNGKEILTFGNIEIEKKNFLPS